MSYEIALIRMPLDLTDDKSTLVQVMAWCRQVSLGLNELNHLDRVFLGCLKDTMTSLSLFQVVNTTGKYGLMATILFIQCVRICLFVYLTH